MDALKRNSFTIAIGLSLTVLTYLVVILLPTAVRMPFHSTLLAAIGAVYLGFSLADGRVKIIVLESTGALVFLAIATIGLVYNPLVLVAGYGLHGIWDLVHHNSKIPGDFAEWYIPFCTSYDWGVGFYLWYLL